MEKYIKIGDSIVLNNSRFDLSQDNKRDLETYLKTQQQNPIAIINSPDGFILFATDAFNNFYFNCFNLENKELEFLDQVYCFEDGLTPDFIDVSYELETLNFLNKEN